MSNLAPKHHQTFEGVRQESADGTEYWSARDLQPILEYNSWNKFKAVIHKAIKACDHSGISSPDHFSQVGKMVPLGSGAERQIPDYHLSRYACYLVVQNGDPSKPVIASGQTYFAIQTRRQELADDTSFRQLGEDEKRLFLRNELKEHNKQLGEVASHAGVKSGLDFAVFQNHGYKGLYGGLAAKDIRERKGLKGNQNILDHMGSAELAANLFRATQTEEKLKQDNVKSKAKANQTHFEVGRKVRKTIQEIGGTAPEELPTPETSVKALERQRGKGAIKKSGDDE